MNARVLLMLMSASTLAGCANERSGKEIHAASAPAPSPAVLPTSPSTARLMVNGMSCPLCSNNLDKQLLRVPGVRKVTVNLGNGEVLAWLDPDAPPTRSQLAQAVDRSGFSLASIDMPTQ